MKQYLNLLRTVLATGQREPNRTGVDTLTIPGEMLKFDLRDGFPAVTTKKLAFNAVKGELIGFLRGSTDVKEFIALGCNVWNENAYAPGWLKNPSHNGELGDMGRIYGAQWRDWQGLACYDPSSPGQGGTIRQVDQIAVALDLLRNNPESRRIIVNAWNAAELDQACLPPCHTMFQLLPRSDGTLHMTMYMRSCDMFLGVPFNIASYALLLELFAAWSGRTAATLTMFLADVHIYVNHIDQVIEQLSRAPLPPPKLKLDLIGGKADFADNSSSMDYALETLIDDLDQESAWLENYDHHPAIKAPMAV